MSRINTNVSSLVAQKSLKKSNADLQIALTRLSTGIRINDGKDDPAGLIASESLRSDIAAVNKSITNSERANQLIATADSALGQVSNLLNDVRGLIQEAANGGVLSTEQLAANQLQIDSSLEAIDRISQTTTFQGRKLIDGSLDFLTTAGTNFTKLSNLQIDQANLGASSSVSVSVNVSTAATQAQVDITGIPASTAAANSTANISLSKSIVQSSGGVLTYGTGTLTLAAFAGGGADGAEGNGTKTVVIQYGQASAGSSYVAATDTLTINIVAADDGSTDVTDLAAAINTASGRSFVATAGANPLVDQAASTPATVTTALTGGRDAGNATIKILADASGTAADGVTATITEDNSITNNTAEASIVSGNISIRVRGTVSYSAIATAINGLTDYSATILTSAGDQNYVETLDTPPAAATLAGGATASGGIAQDVVFALGGTIGSDTFNFKAGTSIAQLASAINLLKDATGVEATVNSTTLELKSSTYGAASNVDIEVITEGVGGTITAGLGAVTKKRDVGADVIATVNGISATGKGNSLSINTATLDFSTSVEAAFTGTSAFTITGGGATFQLGPDIVSNQQARIGIGSVSTGTLGGVSGRLYELKSGGAKSIITNSSGAASVVDEVITKVTSLRGRLGAFQRTTLETNINSLTDTLSNLTDAESSIRDADFAAETARLTRAQILVQSGTQVLQIANQNPQNVLSLLRG
jgi:flagellin